MSRQRPEPDIELSNRHGESENFGYRQELNRTMGRFSSFAISFSLISVLTGIFANFNFGYQAAGSWVVFTWLLVVCGQYLIARVMARLAVRFPISGYGYQWTTRLINPHFGYFIGWMLLIQFLTGFPGIAQTAVNTFFGFMRWQQYTGWMLLSTLLVIAAVTAIHLSGIRMASRINDWGVYAEITGVVILIGLMVASWIASEKMSGPDLRSVISTFSNQTPGFSALSLSLLLGAWCLTGFEAAADLAEETRSPQTIIPRAIRQSLLVSGTTGFLILFLICVLGSSYTAAPKDSHPLLYILENSIGTRATAFLLWMVVISILACAVASMATASRLLFSMARDGMLPYSGVLSRVNKKTKTPHYAILLVGILGCLAIITFREIEVITSVSAILGYIGYAGIMWSSIRKNAGASFSDRSGESPFTAVLALIWAGVVVAALAIPETQLPGTRLTHVPVLAAVIALFIGGLIYYYYTRPKLRAGKAGPPPLNH